MLKRAIEVLRLAGCDRLEIAMEDDLDCVRISAYRSNPPLVADMRVTFVQLENAIDAEEFEAEVLRKLIRKFP